ncbi:MAG: diacylglycerol kinase family lipid kinase [Tissierellia bacterium]|nr:diacylglycerol kinase family lipid kinase [Tissierellia bacterium]
MKNTNKKFLYIISTQAGKGKPTKYIELIKEIIDNTEYKDSYKILNIEKAGQIKEATRNFANEHKSNAHIFVCGGDGSLQEAAQGIYKTNANLGVFPMGTANDFCKALYGNIDIKKLIHESINFQPKKFDLGLINGELFINITSFGFDSLILNETYELLEKNPKLGGNAYFLAIIKSLFSKNYINIKYRLENENEVLEGEGEFTLGAICNMRYYGNGFMPCPNASPFDSVFDICYIRRLGNFEMMPLILKYRKGQHTEHKSVINFQAKRGYIESDEPFFANYDGTLLKDKRLEFEIIPKAINFLFPKDYNFSKFKEV